MDYELSTVKKKKKYISTLETTTKHIEWFIWGLT